MNYTKKVPLSFSDGQFILNNTIQVISSLSVDGKQYLLSNSGLEYTHSIIDYGYKRKWGLTITKSLLSTSTIDYIKFQINCKHYSGLVFHCGNIEVDFSDLEEQGYTITIIGNEIYIKSNFPFNNIILDPTDQLLPNATNKAYSISSTSTYNPSLAVTEFTSGEYTNIQSSNNVYVSSTAVDDITYAGCTMSDSNFQCKVAGEYCVATSDICIKRSACLVDACNPGSCSALTQTTQLSSSCTLSPALGYNCHCEDFGCAGVYCSLASTGQCTISGTCTYACNTGYYNCDNNDNNGCESTTPCWIYTFQRFTFNLSTYTTASNITFCWEGYYSSSGSSSSGQLLWYNITSNKWINSTTISTSESIFCLFFGTNNMTNLFNSTVYYANFSILGNQSMTGYTLTLSSDFSYLNVSYVTTSTTTTSTTTSTSTSTSTTTSTTTSTSTSTSTTIIPEIPKTNLYEIMIYTDKILFVPKEITTYRYLYQFLESIKEMLRWE
jgi:hypothetical protein